jgi:hypothetical protein
MARGPWHTHEGLKPKLVRLHVHAEQIRCREIDDSLDAVFGFESRALYVPHVFGSGYRLTKRRLRDKLNAK